VAFLYTRASEDLISTATLTVNTGSGDSAYPPADLGDLRPEHPAKLTSTSGSFVADLGSAKVVEICAIIHGNFDAGTNVRLQGNATNTWGAPTVDQPFTIPARYADSFPVNVWLDLKTLIPSAGTRTLRFWRLISVSVQTNPIAIGEWVMYTTKRDLGVRNIQYGSLRDWYRPAIIHQTDLFARRIYDLGTTLRTCTITFQPEATVLAQIDTWYRDALGTMKPFLIVPDGGENDAWLVGFNDPQWECVRVNPPNYHTAQIKFQEFSRGLFP
jgi:hypothetical protein